MHRLLVETSQLEEACPTLSKDAAQHLRVVRPKEGEQIELFDGQGRTRLFRLTGGVLRVDAPIRSFPPPTASLTLFACITKGARWDWTIEKATELGVTRIVPVLSARTIVRLQADEYEAKRLRWQRIAEEAARQSDAVFLPEIHAPLTFDESLTLVRETTCFVGALTTPPPKTIGEELSLFEHSPAHFSGGSPLHLSTFIGPEGDFTPEELSALLERATPVSLGSTILRAETAALYALSVLKAFLDVHAR